MNFQTRFRLPEWVIPFSIGPVMMGVISLLAWLIVGGGVTRGPQRIEYVIPAGAAAKVAAGGDITTIPSEAVFVEGDEVVLNNMDDASHQIGPFWVPAHSTSSTILTKDNLTYANYFCTVHPSKTIGFVVMPRNSLLLTFLPTLLFGVPFGLGFAVISRVMKSL